MGNKLTLEWLKAASIRALRTFAQTAVGMFTVGMAINEIKWVYILSVSAVAAVYSILTSFATTLPEVGSDGTLQIDTSSPKKDTYRLNLDTPVEDLGGLKKITLVVDPNADLSTTSPTKTANL